MQIKTHEWKIRIVIKVAKLLKPTKKNLLISLKSCCFERKMKRPCVWPTPFFLEINGNDDELNIFYSFINILQHAN